MVYICRKRRTALTNYQKLSQVVTPEMLLNYFLPCQILVEGQQQQLETHSQSEMKIKRTLSCHK